MIALCQAPLLSSEGKARGAERTAQGLSIYKQVGRLVDPVLYRCSRLRRSVLALASGICSRFGRYRPYMVTLTYAPGSSWAKRDISAYVDRVRQWARRRGVTVPYIWVAELQLDRLLSYKCMPAEAVHYHVLFWVPRGLTLPKSDKQGWWPHGMTRTEVARHAAGYMSKYASKGVPGSVFPKGLRLHGSGSLDGFLRTFRAWWRLPLYVRGIFGPAEPLIRVAGGFYSRETGEGVRSPFTIAIRRGKSGREVWCVPREPFDESQFREMNQRHIEASRRHASAAGYSWLDVKRAVPQLHDKAPEWANA